MALKDTKPGLNVNHSCITVVNFKIMVCAVLRLYDPDWENTPYPQQGNLSKY